MALNTQVFAGVDEVGRGSLFGPVFASAVVLDDPDGIIDLLNAGLNDSKLLTAKKRESLVPLIKKRVSDWTLGQASSREIDAIGIRSATEVAMVRALQKLKKPINLVLVDGVLLIRPWQGSQKSLIHGDRNCPAIAAASVLAKESRDGLIKRLAVKYKGYGLETNVGYGTKLHRKGLMDLGPTELHRLSFLSKIIG